MECGSSGRYRRSGESDDSLSGRKKFPVKNIKFLASARSVGKTLPFKGEQIPVEELQEDSFKDVEIALFSAGASTSLKFAPLAVQAGCVVIDNSSAFRMDPAIPLVVPEVQSPPDRQGPGDHRQPELFDHPDGGRLKAYSRCRPHQADCCINLSGRFRYRQKGHRRTVCTDPGHAGGSGSRP